jgi:TolA-binding protein
VSLLIIGGLFALGVVAILAAVLLGISEQRRENARANAASAPVSLPVEQHTASLPPVSATMTTARPTIPLDRPTARLDHEEPAALPALNGQFHELADEIRELHQQAWDLEQRLSTLTDTINRIERRQNGHTSIEEEASFDR